MKGGAIMERNKGEREILEAKIRGTLKDSDPKTDIGCLASRGTEISEEQRQHMYGEWEMYTLLTSNGYISFQIQKELF